MANKNVTRKEILDSFAVKAEAAIAARREEVKTTGLLNEMEHDTVLEAVTSAVINDVYEQKVRAMKYNRYSLRPGDVFEADGKQYTVADVIEPFSGEIVLVYFEVVDGVRVYTCKTFKVTEPEDAEKTE